MMLHLFRYSSMIFACLLVSCKDAAPPKPHKPHASIRNAQMLRGAIQVTIPRGTPSSLGPTDTRLLISAQAAEQFDAAWISSNDSDSITLPAHLVDSLHLPKGTPRAIGDSLAVVFTGPRIVTDSFTTIFYPEARGIVVRERLLMEFFSR